MTDLVFLGLDRAGLEEAKADQRRYAEKLARGLTASSMVIDGVLTEEILEEVRDIQCVPWPTIQNDV